MSNTSFEILPLNREILSNLKTLGFLEMTPIQEKSLPFILEGKDIIAKAKTGSGKTAAFGLGILSSINQKFFSPQALILCPTRELAEQVSTEIRRLARFTSNIKIQTLCGGSSEYHQERSLSHGTHIVVGTPGRILKLIKRNSLFLDDITTFVLDEADRMLDMGFNEDINNIASYLPSERQTLLFSATFPEEIKDLGKQLQKSSLDIEVDSKHQKDTIKQVCYEVESHKDKSKALLKILAFHRPKTSVIFCKTKQISNDLERFLMNKGLSAMAINGDLEQRERTLTLTKFSNGSCNLLVATDVAARGLDVKDIGAVINFDLAFDTETHIHRIGRTARAGKEGLAINLYVERESFRIEEIEEYLDTTLIKENWEDLQVESEFDLVPSMETILIRGGKKDKVRPGDILGALTGEAGIPASDVGNINILDRISYVAIKAESSTKAFNNLFSGRIKGRNFRVELI